MARYCRASMVIPPSRRLARKACQCFTLLWDRPNLVSHEDHAKSKADFSIILTMWPYGTGWQLENHGHLGRDYTSTWSILACFEPKIPTHSYEHRIRLHDPRKRPNERKGPSWEHKESQASVSETSGAMEPKLERRLSKSYCCFAQENSGGA